MKNKVTAIILSIIIITLLSTVIGLSVVFSRSKKENTTNKNTLELHYQQAFFTLLSESNDMEIQFTKLAVASGVQTEREYLEQIVTNSEVAVNALSALSSQDVNVENTTKFINQAGDFAKYLLYKINNSGTISDEEKTSVLKIRDMLKTLGVSLSKVQAELDSGSRFTGGEKIKSTTLYDIFTGLNDNSVEYPTLIYDGPFSDARATKEVKGVSGEVIDRDTGENIIKNIFKTSLNNIEYLGEWSGDIETLSYNATISGHDKTVQLTKKGGMVLSISGDRDVTATNILEDECINIGRDFLTTLGYYDMVAVWTTNDDSIYYINFAPKVNNVIMYPDLIKVKIAGDNGEILGLEAQNYAYNHTTRTVPSPTLSESEARSKITISGATEGRLCIIPYKTSQEVLCYEYILSSNGTYYIYIDANTGEEIIICVINRRRRKTNIADIIDVCRCDKSSHCIFNELRKCNSFTPYIEDISHTQSVYITSS